jgi:CMP-2-keto-3-deoxyoctulosonic acid synthetase
MKLISQFKSATLGTAALYGLRKQAFTAFAAAPRGSQEQREALATMRVVEAELARRAPSP